MRIIDIFKKVFYKKSSQETIQEEPTYTRKNKINPFKIGDRIISRSNEDDPLMIGEITGFDDFDNPRNEDFPIVKCEKTGKEYICLSILRPYSEELLKELDGKTPKEQWNYMAKNYKKYSFR